MTQDAGLKVSEQGAWLQINLGTLDDPKILRLKLIPADFEELNRINSKIVEAGKVKGGKEGTINADVFANEVVGAIAPHVVDWNLHDEDGKIEINEANKRKQLGRLMIAFATPDPKPGVTMTGTAPERQEDRPTALTLIMAFIGDYSNFLGA